MNTQHLAHRAPLYGLLILGIGAVVGTGLVLSSIASAQTPTTTPGTSTTTQATPIFAPSLPAAGTTPAPMVVDIDSAGNILIRGVVASAGTDSITVTSWGGTWTIQTDSTSSVIPNGTGGMSDLSAISVGDFVGVDGTVSQDTSMTVDAQLVRDWTTNPWTGATGDSSTTTASGDTSDTGFSGSDVGGDASDTSTATNETTNGGTTSSPSTSSSEGDIRTFQGAASTINTFAGTFRLTDSEGTVYTVVTTRTTDITNDSGDTMSDLSGLQPNDMVDVTGTVDGDVITATGVQNTTR
jgi:hypothetical protein